MHPVTSQMRSITRWPVINPAFSGNTGLAARGNWQNLPVFRTWIQTAKDCRVSTQDSTQRLFRTPFDTVDESPYGLALPHKTANGFAVCGTEAALPWMALAAFTA